MGKRNSVLITLFILLLMILLLCYPGICINAAKKGLLLWFNKVLPSLLPFMILVNMIVPLGGLNTYINQLTPLTQRMWKLPGESLLAFIIGLIAGYPMGAKVIKALYDENKLTVQEAQQTLLFSNNCGPLFIIGTVGTAMLGQTQLGVFLFLIHLLTACLMSLLLTRSLSNPTCPNSKIVCSSTSPSFFKLLNLSVMQSMDAITCVGGYIILFSVLIAILTSSSIIHAFLGFIKCSSQGRQLLLGIFSSLLELSNGTNALSQLPLSPFSLALLSAAINFGGICVYFQTLYVLEDTPFHTKTLLLAKGIQCLLSSALTLCLYPFYFSISSFAIHNDFSLYTPNTYPIHLFYGLILFASCLLCIYFFFSPTHKRIFSTHLFHTLTKKKKLN